ncbi:MAG TPA: hypothetical protein VHR97_02155 [Candidatus Baltobacteraceae bacterium]|nr:hypothetical protein [Candidatus Baltobacteraceae bacterium]
MKLTAVTLSLVGVALGATLAYPHVQASPLEPDAKPPCKTSKACFSQSNQGTGAALKGISLDATLGNFGSGGVIAQADGLGGIYSFSKQFYGGEFESGSSSYALIAATDSSSGTAFIAERPAGRAYINGAGAVRFDPAFERAIAVRAPLYVAQKFARGFTVRESQGGRSSILFDYRIVARRAGSSEARLPEIQMPQLPRLARGNS